MSATGAQADRGAGGARLSQDGRLVAFISDSTNLVPGDTNGKVDAFVRDNRTGSIERVSVSTSGAQSDANAQQLVMTPDGRYVAFTSMATTLVSGTVGDNVYVRDRVTGITERIPRTGTSQLGRVVLSADGRFVAYGGARIYVYDRTLHALSVLPVALSPGNPTSFSADGRYVVVDAPDAIVYDLQIHFWGGGLPGTFGLISADATTIAYTLRQPVFPVGFVTDVSVRDLASGADEVVSLTNDGQRITNSTLVNWSADGRFVMFETKAPGVPDDTNGAADLYVRDRVMHRTFLVSRAPLGAPGNGVSTEADISADGRYVAFSSLATNIVTNDTNDTFDVFVRSFPQPEAHTVSPATVARATTTTVAITGAYLSTDTQVVINGPGVTVNSVTHVSDQELDVSVTVAADAPTGTRTVWVERPGTGPGVGAGAVGICTCLTVA